MLEFEDDKDTWGIKDQFMLGGKLMMAPIFKAKAVKRDFYLPKGTWAHYFTGEKIISPGAWVKDADAPLGQPIVYSLLSRSDEEKFIQ